MAIEQRIEQRSTNLSDVQRERPIALPAGEILTTEEAIKRLQISDPLSQANVIPFLASQSVRLKEITERPEIKALYGTIPEYLHSESAPVVTALSSDEQTALGEWRQERRTLLQSQSGNLDDLENEIQGYIDEAIKNNPDMFDKTTSGGSMDVMEQWFTGEIMRETDETKKKYQQLMAMAASSGNPDDVILAMTFRHSQNAMAKVGKLLESFKTNTEAMDRLQADLDLKGFKGDISQSDMMKANMEFGRTQGDLMNTMQLIQRAMGDYERTMQSGGSLAKGTKEIATQIQSNYKS